MYILSMCKKIRLSASRTRVPKVPCKLVGILYEVKKNLCLSKCFFIYGIRRSFVPNFKILRSRAVSCRF